MDSRQAIPPVALRVNANLFQTDLCRNPEYKDVLIDMTLRPIKSSRKNSEWMRYECHPWQLDPGSPCRDDGLGVFSLYKICVYQYFLLFIHRD